ncbi:DUF2804 domain-containing protein [Salipaludibacillus sp. HK11]|uniref:DUF2804 domain-containing protein n=1 Tax=Salipaludibacillus sp. HK11 TaxID=3394320 RepID=UPI0039FBC0BD
MVRTLTLLSSEREITSPVMLCDQKGKLNRDSIGWSRKPIVTSNLTRHFLRKKKWNYWCVFGQDAMFSATVSHLDYALVCFVYYLEYETNDYFEKTIIVPLKGGDIMPDTVSGSVEVIHKDNGLFFIYDGQSIHLKVSSKDFGGKSLKADIKIYCPDTLESLNVVVPWSNDKFQYTSKQQCLPAEGEFSVGEKSFTFNKANDSAVLDFGRGDWPRRISWNWGMASGKQGKDMIGLNFGGKWTDGTGITENGLLINDKLTKIHEPVDFIYDDDQLMDNWRINSKDTDDIRLEFTPFFKRSSTTNLWLVKSQMFQLFGYYSGEIKTHQGEKVKISKLIGSIEDHVAKW